MIYQRQLQEKFKVCCKSNFHLNLFQGFLFLNLAMQCLQCQPSGSFLIPAQVLKKWGKKEAYLFIFLILVHHTKD